MVEANRVPRQRFYRIVKANPPTRRDFLSNRAGRGEPRPDLPSPLQRLWDGISVHDTLADSLRQVQEHPRLGGYIAELEAPKPGGQSVRWERTIANNAGHFTLWGDPDELLGCVVRIIPVNGERP